MQGRPRRKSEHPMNTLTKVVEAIPALLLALALLMPALAALA
jgi:hypothetical protein